eukprot:GEMP01010296.1.p1 GENE.GEMP01010296.1~~GEMP01010296.1.p1  ORF type:complete len:520 (+),score=67.36 GEMP01010296.1:208-1767(+)
MKPVPHESDSTSQGTAATRRSSGRFRRPHPIIESTDISSSPSIIVDEEVDPEPRVVVRLANNPDAAPLLCPNSPLAMEPITIHSPRQRTEEEKRGTVFSSIVNLTATTMGVGMLSLPHAFAQTGVVAGVVLIWLSAVLADRSLIWLVKIARATDRYSFEGNADFFFHYRGRICLNVVLIILLFGACVSVFEVFQKLIPSAIRNFAECAPDECNTVFLGEPFISFVCVLSVGYFLVQDSMHKLRHISFLALGGLAYYFIVLLATFTNRSPPMIHPSVKMFGSVSDCLMALPVMFSAYICQFNIFKVDIELKADSRKYLGNIIHFTIFGIATSAYTIGGLLGYFIFGAHVGDNVLDDFHSVPTTIASGALGLTNLTKLPLLFIPLRKSIQENLGTEEYRYSLSAVLILLVYITSIMLGSLTKALSITGITAGCAICFVFPGAMYYAYLKKFTLVRTPNLLHEEGNTEEEGGLGISDALAQPAIQTRRGNEYELYISGGVASFGVVIGTIGLINIIAHWKDV